MASTRLIDVQLVYLADAPKPLKHNAEVDFFCGAAERELNIRGHDQGHERVKRVGLRMVAAMMAKGVQAGDLDWSTGPTRFVPWEDQSPSSVLGRISDRWDVEKWRAIGRYPDPGETGWLSEEKR